MSPPALASQISSWLWRYASAQPLHLLAVALLQTAGVLIELLKPWPIVFLIDSVLRGAPMPAAVEPWVHRLVPDLDRGSLANWVVALTVLLLLLEWLIELAARYASLTLTQSMSYAAAADLFRKLLALSPRFHARRMTGDLIRRLTVDCGAAALMFRDTLVPAATSLLTLSLMFIIMWRIDARLTLIAGTVAPCMALVFWLYAGSMMERSYREQEAEGRIYDVVEHTFSAIPAVQAFGRELANLQGFQAATAGVLRAAVSSVNIQLQFKSLIGLATALGTAAIIWFGGASVLRGEMSLGSVILFLSYLTSLYAPLQAIMYTGATLQSGAASAKRVLEIMQIEPEVVDRPQAQPLRHVSGALVFEGVDFEYDAGRPVLRDISFEIEAGQTVALVGHTGAGKSTLASLVPRFFDPSRGRILIDGHDLRDVTLATLRRHIAIVPQDSFLFPITIAENIAHGNQGATPPEIENAARVANAHDFISRLPNGYDTRVGERGAALSGGERQRVSIARALLKDARILVLDEPTSSLDVGAEALVLYALRKLMISRTTLIISHRLKMVRNADLILFLKSGSIVESGTHQELMHQGQGYARFVALQSQSGEFAAAGSTGL
jgi:ATP-binding cassette subfamily B protein